MQLELALCMKRWASFIQSLVPQIAKLLGQSITAMDHPSDFLFFVILGAVTYLVAGLIALANCTALLALVGGWTREFAQLRIFDNNVPVYIGPLEGDDRSDDRHYDPWPSDH